MFNYDLRIMLVEDHPFQLKATQYLLKSYGFTRVTAVNNAENALQALTRLQRPYDILLCDQCLPDLCGLELIGIASHQGLIQQAIILSSLDSSELDILKKNAHEWRLPLLGYLAKPLKQSEFINLLIPTNTINGEPSGSSRQTESPRHHIPENCDSALTVKTRINKD